MKLKIFDIRLDNDNLVGDQENLNNFLNGITVKKTSTALIEGQINYWSVVVFYNDEKPQSNKRSGKFFFSAETVLTEEETKIYASLKQWRFDKANEFRQAAFMISSNTELITIAKVKPQSENELLKIRGFSGRKVAKYGGDIIALLNSI